MKIIFFGTPEFVIPIAEILRKEFRNNGNENALVAVVTQPPRPAGREQKITYSAIDNWAFKKKIRIITDLKEELPQADIGILAAYGKIIPERIINHFRYGILNIHPSLLPKYRGASPIQAAIAAGETITGVSIINMDSQLDHGPIITQFKEEIAQSDTSQDLYDRLFKTAAEVLVTLIPAYTQDKIKLKDQDHNTATMTTTIHKDHCFIPLKYLKLALLGKESKEPWPLQFIKDFQTNASPASIHNLIRAAYPWPVAWTKVRINGQEKRLKLIHSELIESKLTLKEVQLEGKDPVSWEEFQKSYFPEASPEAFS